MSIREITEQHRYPGWLFRFPRWIYVHYFFLSVFFLRSRLCHQMLRNVFKSLNPGSGVLDIGCGEGQYLIPSARRFLQLDFSGLDKRSAHTRFLKNLIRNQNIENCQVSTDDVENYTVQYSKFQFVYLIGVLQYLSAPEELMMTIYQHAPPGHRLMVYSPVQPAFHYRFYTRIRERYSHYDASQKTYQGIEKALLLDWIQSTGYRIIHQRVCYGKFATLGHEVMQSLIILYTHWPVWLKIFPLLIFIVLSPIFVSLQIVDPWLKPTRGNALLIILQK